MDFRAIASKKLEEIERPKNPPVGEYIWQITKVPSIETSKDEAWDFVDFQLKCIAPTDTVDPDALREWGGDVSKLRQRLRFMFNKSDPVEFDRTQFRLKQFLEEHVKCGQEGMSITEAMNASVNGQFIGAITWTQDKKDETNFFANLGKTGPLV